ncbi:MAG: hypothetical protein NTV51_10265 [Verrucomicrobia bacterium]|nr:hypothetical protein [Verrucomicrobiota bacterium]
MTFTDDELISLIEEVTTTLGQIFLFHRGLTEGLLDQDVTVRSQKKIDDLKKRLEVEREKLSQTRQAQQRRKELERLRKDHEDEIQTEGVSKKLTQVRDQRGRPVGWIQSVGVDRVNVLDQRGRVVGRFINGQTYDQQGRFIGAGDQGLRVLGQTLKKVGS